MENVITALVIAAITGLAATLFADQRLKGAAKIQSDNFGVLKGEVKALQEDCYLFHRGEIIRLQAEYKALGVVVESKASRESVTTIGGALDAFKKDMDKRFDRLEHLLEKT
jgi:hypothetical protein